MKFKKMFEPINIGKCWIKNRLALAPINATRFCDEWGTHSQRLSEYYVEFAKGGVGLLISGAIKVENESEHLGDVGRSKYVHCAWQLFDAPKAAMAYHELLNRIHAYGSKMFFQLSAGPGRNSWWPGYTAVSSSENPVASNPNATTRALTTEEVEKIVKAYGMAAKTCSVVGVDGIEVHGHEGYLIDQFITAAWNKRTDKYGGSLEGRTRFPIEILHAIKDSVGKDYPVEFRISLKHFIKSLERNPETGELHYTGSLRRQGFKELGRDLDESMEIIRLLAKAGYDGFHIDSGCHDSIYWAHPPGYMGHNTYSDYAEMVKKIVNVPVIAVGRLDVPKLAEDILEQGKADLIALGRGLLADPYWPKKVQDGKLEDIRPCLGCQEGCLTSEKIPKYLGCQVNAVCGREILYAQLVPASQKKKVLVIGGGVAGMEAARVAAIRGHSVSLYERTDNLGGHIIEAGVPDFKEDYRQLVKWYKTQLGKLPVKIIFKTEVGKELIEKENPGIIVVATGSSPVIPNIPGVKGSNVVTCCSLLMGKSQAGNNVVVVGGGSVGLETALWLAQQGKKVTVLEMLKEVAGDMASPNRAMLLDMLDERGVTILTSVFIQEIGEREVDFVKNNKRNTIKCDTVALAAGMNPENKLYRALIADFSEVYAIGDCNIPKKIEQAVFEGYTIAMSI